MSRQAGGSGSRLSDKETQLVRASYGPQLPAALDLNKAKSKDLAAHPLIGRRLASRIVSLRRKTSITTPVRLFHAGLIDRRHLRALEAGAFGAERLRPLMQRIKIDGP